MTISNLESAQPPISQVSPATWVKKNLFNSWFNSLLTLLSLSFIVWLAVNLFNWAFNLADWTVLEANFRLFFVGRYPVKSLWRAWTTLGIIVALGGFPGVFWLIGQQNYLIPVFC